VKFYVALVILYSLSGCKSDDSGTHNCGPSTFVGVYDLTTGGGLGRIIKDQTCVFTHMSTLPKTCSVIGQFKSTDNGPSGKFEVEVSSFFGDCDTVKAKKFNCDYSIGSDFALSCDDGIFSGTYAQVSTDPDDPDYSSYFCGPKTFVGVYHHISGEEIGKISINRKYCIFNHTVTSPKYCAIVGQFKSADEKASGQFEVEISSIHGDCDSVKTSFDCSYAFGSNLSLACVDGIFPGTYKQISTDPDYVTPASP